MCLSKDDVIELEGTVIESLPTLCFRIELPNGHKILGAYFRQAAYEFYTNSARG